VNAQDAQLALARAAYDPEAAMEAVEHIDPLAPPLEAPVGVLAPERIKQHALTLAVEVDEVPPNRRWRFFVFYQLMRLACWFYPFKFSIYRTRAPWE
jgi:hypothetical protein